MSNQSGDFSQKKISLVIAHLCIEADAVLRLLFKKITLVVLIL
jgi:hypothetical protein